MSVSSACAARSGMLKAARIDGKAVVNDPSSFGTAVDAMDVRAFKQCVRNVRFSRANSRTIEVTILPIVAVISLRTLSLIFGIRSHESSRAPLWIYA